MAIGKSRRVAVLERVAAPTTTAAATPIEPEGLWGVGLLRVALELKRPGAPELPEIVAGVAARMRLPHEQFVAFVEQSFGPLEELGRDNRV